METGFKSLKGKYGRRAAGAVEAVSALEVETPSWGFGRGGTRFASYTSGGDPVCVSERIASAARFARITGKGKTVALHFPWDGSTKKDVRALGKMLKKAALRPGSVNANLFTPREAPLDARLRFGSLVNPSAAVRQASIGHMIDCIDYMRLLGSDTLVLWLPDGTNSPGQMSFYDQADRLEKSVGRVCRSMRKNERLLIEYKLFEPAMYSTAIQDYARSAELCEMLGSRAKVLVDLGHHAPGVNVEQIVAQLIRRGLMGGFHFNDHGYADDDLASGSLHPHQLFRIFCTMVEGEIRGYTPLGGIALMIDQSHNVKDPLEELIESLENIETACAKAMLVDYGALKKAQDDCDPSKADRILNDAFLADVRPLLAESRRARGLPADPHAAARKKASND